MSDVSVAVISTVSVYSGGEFEKLGLREDFPFPSALSMIGSDRKAGRSSCERRSSKRCKLYRMPDVTFQIESLEFCRNDHDAVSSFDERRSRFLW